MINKIKNKKKIIAVIGICSVILIASSYAFFSAFVGNAANTDVNVGTGVTEKLIFTKGGDISLVANQENFAQGSGSLTASTTSSATLIADSGLGNATKTYNAYFEISDNNYVYTVDENTPEMLLKITNPEGGIVDSIEGVTYKTVTDASTGETLTGFDITTFTGLLKINEDYSISTTNSTDGVTQDWTAEIIFVNLDSNQSLNEGKSLKADFILQSDKLLVNEMITGSSFNYKIGYSNRRNVTHISFENSIDLNAYNSSSSKYDFSTYGNEGIVGYVTTEAEGTTLHIQSNRRIIANPDLSKMFSGFSSLKSINFNGFFNTSYVTNLSEFLSVTGTLTFSFDDLNLVSVTNMNSMFLNSNMENMNLDSLDTSKVLDMNSIFEGTTNLTTAHVNSLETSHLTEFKSVFESSDLLNVDLSSLDLTNADDVSSLFSNTDNLTTAHILMLNNYSPTVLSSLFARTDLLNVDVSLLDVSAVTDMSYMFSSSSNLNSSQIIDYDVRNVTDLSGAFADISVSTINLGNYVFNDNANLNDMFNSSRITNIYFPVLGNKNLGDAFHAHAFKSQSIFNIYVKNDTDKNLVNSSILGSYDSDFMNNSSDINGYINDCMSAGEEYHICERDAFDIYQVTAYENINVEIY